MFLFWSRRICEQPVAPGTGIVLDFRSGLSAAYPGQAGYNQDARYAVHRYRWKRHPPLEIEFTLCLSG